MKSYPWKKLIASGFIIILFSGFFAGKDDLYFEISKNIDLFTRVYKEISFNYVDEVNPEEFMQSGIKGMLSSLDPYTVFIDENRKDEIELLTNGKYGGIGITIGIRGNNVTIVEVLEGYSAQRQGIRIGDVLIEASGVGITPDNMDEISTLVKGEPGTPVEITVLRNESADTLRFDLIREEIILKNIPFAGFYPENSNNVYIKLTNFSRSAGDELRKTLRELKSVKKINSIVLDLRGNPGGLLDVAVDICDKFLTPDLLIVSTKGRDESFAKNYYSMQEPQVGEAKLVVLINQGSASASEIVAGAIQDHDRGIILGTKSFGKGLVQTITPLNYNTSLKITTAKYYTPSGRCIQKIDYSKHNNTADSLNPVLYKTARNRVVYSAGGITPDTTISFEVEGDITKELLAKGMFFRFSDNYYYKNQNTVFDDLDENRIYNSFTKYIAENEFTYVSDAEKQVDKLISDVEKKKNSSDLRKELLLIKNQFRNIASTELEVYKDEIIREIKSELASRYLGSEGRIKELLNYDLQLKTALSILEDKTIYDKLLNIN
jgi:carboxyl-terminal processing protease